MSEVTVQPLRRQQPDDQPPTFYTVAEVASIFRWPTSTVYRGVATKAIPSVRLGRVIRIPETWVEAFIAAQLQETALAG